MKRSFVLICVLLLLSCACAQAEPLRIGVMSGPTGMGMAKLMSDGAEAYTFDVYAAPTEATADLASGTLDLLCLPTNTAASLANAKEDYVTVLAINCLGSLYLLTDAESSIASVADLDGQIIYAGVPTSTTGPILESIFQRAGVQVTIEWEADHDAVVTRMLRGDIHIAVLPEPKATVAMTKSEGWQVALNISEEWSRVIDTRLPMGCIVTRNAVLVESKNAVDQFLADYAASIAFIGDPANRAESAQMIADAGVLPAAGVAMKALGNLYGAIVYEDGADMKADLTAFYDLVGLKQPVDGFYYEK